MCCGCGCHEGFRTGHYMGHQRGYDFPLMTIEEEIETLDEMKETMEKRLENVNKRLEALKKGS